MILSFNAIRCPEETAMHDESGQPAGSRKDLFRTTYLQTQQLCLPQMPEWPFFHGANSLHMFVYRENIRGIANFRTDADQDRLHARAAVQRQKPARNKRGTHQVITDTRRETQISDQ